MLEIRAFSATTLAVVGFLACVAEVFSGRGLVIVALNVSPTSVAGIFRDAAPDPQRLFCSASDNSDLESIPDQPDPRWEDRELMYKKRIHDLEKEVAATLKIKNTLSRQLYEMGCLVFSEVDPHDSTSPSFVDKLKVYLECLQLEREQLKKRAQWAKQTLWKMQNELSDPEKLALDCGYPVDRFAMPASIPPLPPFPTQPIRLFLSKTQSKSPEKKEAERNSGKWAEESFGGAVPKKQSPVRGALAKIHWRSPSKLGSTEAESSVPMKKRDIFTEHSLPQTIFHSGPGSYWPPLEHSQRSPARASVGHDVSCVAQVHRHWSLEREQEGRAQFAEDGGLSTTRPLPVATPSASDTEGIRVSLDPTVSLDVSPTLKNSKMENCNIWSEMQHRATTERKYGIKRQGEGATSKEEEYVTLESISLKPVGLARNLSDAQTNPQKLANRKARIFQDLSGNTTLQTEVSLPGKDSFKSVQSQSINIVHSSNQTTDPQPGTRQVVLAEQAFRSLDPLHKPRFSSLELILNPDLLSSSTKAPETIELLEEKRVLEEAPGLTKKTDQPMKEKPTVASPPQLKPEELLLSDPYEALTSTSLKSLQPASLTEEGPSSLAEETAVEEN